MNSNGTLTSPITGALRDEAARIEEDTEHSAKRHFNACDTWSTLHYGLGLPATFAAVAASAAIVKEAPVLAQILGMAAAVLSALMTFLKPNDRATQHKNVGNQYLALRNDARIYSQIELLENTDDAKKSEKLKRLALRRNELNAAALPTPRRAFERTRQGIAQGETAYKVDKKD